MPIVVCACLAALTALAAITADELARSEAAMRRAAISQRARERIAEAIDPAIARLQDLAAASGQDRPDTLTGFDAVAPGLEQDPAMGGAGLIEVVSASERPSFERRHGQIKALRDGLPAGPAPQRSEYYVVTAVLTRPGQPRDIGANLGEEPARLASLLAAAHTGEPQATEPVRRVGTHEYETALYVPVYAPSPPGTPHVPDARGALRSGPDAHTYNDTGVPAGSGSSAGAGRPGQRADVPRGYVASAYRFALLRPDVIEALAPGTALALFDGRSKLLSSGTVTDPLDTSISVAGRSWVLAVGEPAANLSLTETVIIVGALLTALLGALSFQAARRERYALAMVDRRLAERERAELALRQLTANDPLGPGRIETRLEWVQRIRSALDDDRLTLHAQPVVQTATGRTTQHELLVRMVGPDGSLVSPAQFLPIAERFGLIREIDRWVVTETITLLSDCAQEGPGPTIEINLSGQSLGDRQLATHIGHELRRTQVDPSRLIFEVTETTAIGNIAAARAFAQQLARLGCRFALDDFGAGFGSFYYLKHLPFDYIKIDGEFVRNCTVDPTDRLVIRAVVKLAQGLGTSTIAEFVGDEATYTTVTALGVDYAQGYHLGKPVPARGLFGLPAPGRSGR